MNETLIIDKGEFMNHAEGTFDVKITPMESDDAAREIPGRNLIGKQFYGDLQGTSKGQMLTALTQAKGSAGYVAIEEVEGELNGRFGTFILQHNGVMSQGNHQLTIVVVPDSATGGFAGLTGSMSISIDENGKHTYDFSYTLPNQS